MIREGRRDILHKEMPQQEFERGHFLSVVTKACALGFAIIMMTACVYTQAVRFIVTGDTRGADNGVNTVILSEMVQAVLNEKADFVLIAGDLVNGSGEPAVLESQLITWRDTMQPLYTAGVGVYPCRGNHDTGNYTVWKSIFSGEYALPGNGSADEKYITFSFTYGNVFVVSLDVYSGDGGVNQPWLDTQFAQNRQPHVFVFSHVPAFKVWHRDCLADNPNERNTFWKSIKAEGGRIYFCGHDHFYNHARIDDNDDDPSNDLHQYVVATGGAPLYGWEGDYDGDNGRWRPHEIFHEKQYGYVLVEINGLDVTLTWKHRTAAGVYESTEDIFTYTASP
jgi:hypothetical protein